MLMAKFDKETFVNRWQKLTNENPTVESRNGMQQLHRSLLEDSLKELENKPVETKQPIVKEDKGVK